MLSLLTLLGLYIIFGVFYIQPSRYTPFVSTDLKSIFATAGLIFVSFGGLTKVCSVAEEVKNPGRNIPLGMFISWITVSLLYILVIFVTIGLVDSTQLHGSLTPISLGGEVLMGGIGKIILAIVLYYLNTSI